MRLRRCCLFFSTHCAILPDDWIQRHFLCRRKLQAEIKMEREKSFFLHFICLMPISFRHWASFPLANDALTKRVTLTRSRERDLRRIFEWQRVAESAARWLATSRLLPLSSTQQPAIQLEGVEARAFVDCALVFFPQKEFVLSSVHTDCEIDTNEIDQFLRLLLQKT